MNDLQHLQLYVRAELKLAQRLFPDIGRVRLVFEHIKNPMTVAYYMAFFDRITIDLNNAKDWFLKDSVVIESRIGHPSNFYEYLTWVLYHELGHAIQSRSFDLMEKLTTRTTRVFESHADKWATEKLKERMVSHG